MNNKRYVLFFTYVDFSDNVTRCKFTSFETLTEARHCADSFKTFRAISIVDIEMVSIVWRNPEISGTEMWIAMEEAVERL